MEKLSDWWFKTRYAILFDIADFVARKTSSFEIAYNIINVANWIFFPIDYLHFQKYKRKIK